MNSKEEKQQQMSDFIYTREDLSGLYPDELKRFDIERAKKIVEILHSCFSRWVYKRYRCPKYAPEFSILNDIEGAINPCWGLLDHSRRLRRGAILFCPYDDNWLPPENHPYNSRFIIYKFKKGSLYNPKTTPYLIVLKRGCYAYNDESFFERMLEENNIDYEKLTWEPKYIRGLKE